MKLKARIEKLFNYISRPQNIFKNRTPYPDPKNSPVGPQKVKNDPRTKSKSKVTIEENIENEKFFTTLVDPKTFFEPYPDLKKSSIDPKKQKKTLELGQHLK